MIEQLEKGELFKSSSNAYKNICNLRVFHKKLKKRQGNLLNAKLLTPHIREFLELDKDQLEAFLYMLDPETVEAMARNMASCPTVGNQFATLNTYLQSFEDTGVYINKVEKPKMLNRFKKILKTRSPELLAVLSGAALLAKIALKMRTDGVCTQVTYLDALFSSATSARCVQVKRTADYLLAIINPIIAGTSITAVFSKLLAFRQQTTNQQVKRLIDTVVNALRIGGYEREYARVQNMLKFTEGIDGENNASPQ